MKLNNINLMLAIIWLIVCVLIIINKQWSDIVASAISGLLFGTYLSGWIQGRDEY